jgi:hypothetical protein
MRELKPHLDIFGLIEIAKGVYKSPSNYGSGTLRYREGVGKVAVLSASGALLEYFRTFLMFHDYLYQISKFPSRVTMLHATADYAVDAPPAINALHKKALRGTVALTRKRVVPSQVKAILSPDQFNRLTGTVYLGNRANADVWAKVYDKRHERLSKGYPDIGSRTRVEIAVQSDVGASLRDAADPAALFYHFASPELVEAPKDIYPWLPLSEGFDLPPDKPEPLPMARVQSLLDFSDDVTRICTIAVNAFGDEAPDLLAIEMRKRCAKQLRGMGHLPHAD